MEIPINNYQDRQTYYGALNLLEPDLILENIQQEMEKILSKLSKIYKKKCRKRLLIFWDGVRHHTGENTALCVTKRYSNSLKGRQDRL